MFRRPAITFFVLLVSLLVARQASATSIPATDLDLWLPGAGSSVVAPLVDQFDVAAPPPPTVGKITNDVFFDGTYYTYTHTVLPSLNNNTLFDTEFAVGGFTGIAGWSFSSASAIGGAGNALDFALDEIAGRLLWRPIFGDGAGWDSAQPITFFFVSTKGPTIGDYNLSSSDVGTAQSFAPVPEPGSIALLGSGLVSLYAAVRRRRNLHV